MNNLNKFLASLHAGHHVNLERMKNQGDDEVAVDYLYIQDGAWMRGKLNCWSSAEYGFGTCRCHNHPAFEHFRVSRKYVLEELRKLLRQESEDRAARQAEIAWLEEQLKAL